MPIVMCFGWCEREIAWVLESAARSMASIVTPAVCAGGFRDGIGTDGWKISVRWLRLTGVGVEGDSPVWSLLPRYSVHLFCAIVWSLILDDWFEAPIDLATKVLKSEVGEASDCSR